MAAGGTVHTLTANHSQFTAAMQQVTIQVNHQTTAYRNAASGAQALNQATNQTAGASGNAARGILELSRGVEDAAVSFGTGGFQGAIRGSLNNLTQFASMVGGPITGAIAGFAAAGISLGATFFKMGEDSKEAQKKMEELGETLRKVAADRAEFSARVQQANTISEATGVVGGVEKEITKREAEIQATRELIRFNETQIRRLDEAMARSEASGGFGSFADIQIVEQLAPQRAELEKQVEDQKKILDQLITDRQTSAQQLNEANKNLQEARARGVTADAFDLMREEEEARIEAVEQFEKMREEEETRIRIETQKNIDKNVAEFEKNREGEEARLRIQQEDRLDSLFKKALSSRRRDSTTSPTIGTDARVLSDVSNRARSTEPGPQEMVDQMKLIVQELKRTNSLQEQTKALLREAFDDVVTIENF